MTLLSDTHGTIDPDWRTHFQDCDEIWHAGDIGSPEVADWLEQWAPLRAVWGNIDGPELRRRFPQTQRFELEGISVWMTHIVSRSFNQQLQKEERPPDLLVFGHTHVVQARRDRHGIFRMNPGACGREGSHLAKTLMRLELRQRKVTGLQLIDLGPR